MLVCLLGHCGDIIVDVGKDGYRVAEDIPFIAPSDKVLINQIVRVGYEYSRINAFAEKITDFDSSNRRVSFVEVDRREKDSNSSPKTAAFQETRHGIYLRALGTSLNSKLANYREVIMHEEKAYMLDQTRPLSQLMFSLRKYSLLFPAIINVIQEIEDKRICGAALCNCIYRASITGFEQIKSFFDSILFALHSVMYNQMLAWVLHGTLIDTHSEFFIAQTRLNITNDLNPRNLLRAELARGIYSGGDVSSSQSRIVAIGERTRNLATINHQKLQHSFNWRSRYYINYEMLPDMYLPLQVAETLLFIGKAVQVLKQASPHIVAADEAHIAAIIAALRKRDTFNLFLLQKALDTIRQVVSNHLWDVVCISWKTNSNSKATIMV